MVFKSLRRTIASASRPSGGGSAGSIPGSSAEGSVADSEDVPPPPPPPPDLATAEGAVPRDGDHLLSTGGASLPPQGSPPSSASASGSIRNGRAATAVDHMNLPELKPAGKPTELHRLVLSRDWDAMRAGLGLEGAEWENAPPLGANDEEGDAGAETDADEPAPILSPRKEGGIGLLGGVEGEGEGITNGGTPARGGRGGIARLHWLGAFSSPGSDARKRHRNRNGSFRSSATPQSANLIKRFHCLSRDGSGRTPLHLVLLRYTAGSLVGRNLTLRRAPDDVVLALMQHEPLAAGVPDGEGMMPLHLATREGHGPGVMRALLDAYEGAASESDAGGRHPVDYAVECACRGLPERRGAGSGTGSRRVAVGAGGGDVADGMEGGGWEAVEMLLRAAPEAAAPSLSAAAPETGQGKKAPPPSSSSFSSAKPPGRGGAEAPRDRPPVPLLRCLSRCAPPSIIRLLIPPTAQYLSSRQGASDARAALYLAIANDYPLPAVQELAEACPDSARHVRDETGMGLVSACYVVWAYGRRDGDGDKASSKDDSDAGKWDADWESFAPSPRSDAPLWARIKDRRDMLRNVIADASGPNPPPALTGEFKAWWDKVQFFLRYCRDPPSVLGPASAPPGRPDPGLDCSSETPSLLHDALSNPDVPPQVVYLLLRIHPDLASTTCHQTSRLPLHVAAVTPSYSPRHYEADAGPSTSLELVLRAYPRAVVVMEPSPVGHGESCGRLPLHLALWVGCRTWSEGVAALVRSEPRAVRIRDMYSNGVKNGTGLFPFQMAAAISSRPPTEADKVRLAHAARNRFANGTWRAMSLRHRAAEVVRVRRERELEGLRTCYELLRAAPDLVESGIVEESVASSETDVGEGNAVDTNNGADTTAATESLLDARSEGCSGKGDSGPSITEPADPLDGDAPRPMAGSGCDAPLLQSVMEGGEGRVREMISASASSGSIDAEREKNAARFAPGMKPPPPEISMEFLTNGAAGAEPAAPVGAGSASTVFPSSLARSSSTRSLSPKQRVKKWLHQKVTVPASCAWPRESCSDLGTERLYLATQGQSHGETGMEATASTEADAGGAAAPLVDGAAESCVVNNGNGEPPPPTTAIVGRASDVNILTSDLSFFDLVDSAQAMANFHKESPPTGGEAERDIVPVANAGTSGADSCGEARQMLVADVGEQGEMTDDSSVTPKDIGGGNDDLRPSPLEPPDSEAKHPDSVESVRSNLEKPRSCDVDPEHLIHNSVHPDGALKATMGASGDSPQCRTSTKVDIFQDWMNLYNIDRPADEAAVTAAVGEPGLGILKKTPSGKEEVGAVAPEGGKLGPSTGIAQNSLYESSSVPCREINVIVGGLTATASETQSTDCSEFSSSATMLCLSCGRRKRQMLLLPCRHLCLCGPCTEGKGREVDCCPICRRAVSNSVEVFF